MKTIIFFAPKGGSGRTTAVMTAAAAFIEAGHKVGVLDITGEAANAARGEETLITRWKDSMVASGISAEALTTAPAWDHNSYMTARHHFNFMGCTVLLVDTPVQPSDFIRNLFYSVNLIVMPFTSDSAATWISHWTDMNLCSRAKMFGLAMGLTGSEEHQAVHRKALYGSPILKTGLPHSDIFASQLMQGSLYKMIAGSGPLDYSEAELLSARSSATALAKELDTRARARTIKGYSINDGLATGHPFAHLQILRALSPEAFC